MKSGLVLGAALLVPVFIAILWMCGVKGAQGDATADQDEGQKILNNLLTRPRVTTPLLSAVAAQDVDKVRQILEAGTNPNDPDATVSPLYQAIMTRLGYKFQCNLPIVELLLAHGADPNRADPMLGSMPLLEAFAIGDLKCAEAIRAAGAPVDTRGTGGSTILHEAVAAALNSGDLTIIDAALSWGISKDVRLRNGDTALHSALGHGGLKALKAVDGLLDRGFDPCLKNNEDHTTLSLAILLWHDRPDVPQAAEIISLLKGATKCQ